MMIIYNGEIIEEKVKKQTTGTNRNPHYKLDPNG